MMMTEVFLQGMICGVAITGVAWLITEPCRDEHR